MGEKKEGGGGGDAAAAEGGAGAAASRALQQCGQLQKLIDISIGSLRGLRTKCAVSNDLTQQEIRTLEVRRPRRQRVGDPGWAEGDPGLQPGKRPPTPPCLLLFTPFPVASLSLGRPLCGFLSLLHSLMRQPEDPSVRVLGAGRGGAEWELGWRLRETVGGVGCARTSPASPPPPPPHFQLAGPQHSFSH